MSQWYFKIGSYEIPTPDQLSYELYPQSDLIRIASYDMTGRFLGTAEKFTFTYDTMLESERHTLFENIMDYDAQKAWLTGSRKFIYRMGSKIRQMDAYVGALSQDFMNNFMGAETDNWVWSEVGFSIISKNAIASEVYTLGEGG